MMGEPAVGVKVGRGYHQRFGARSQKSPAVQESGKGKVTVGASGNKFAAMRAMFERGAAEDGENKPAPPPRRRAKDSSMKRPDSWILQDKTEEKTAEKTEGRSSRAEDDKNAAVEKHKLSSHRTVDQKTPFSREKTAEKTAGRSSWNEDDKNAAVETHKLSSHRTVNQKTPFSRSKTTEDRLGSNIRAKTDRAPELPKRESPKTAPRDQVLRKATPSSAPTEDVETSKTSKPLRRLVNGVSEEPKHSETRSISTPKVATERFTDETVLTVTEERKKMADTKPEKSSEMGGGGSLTAEVVFVDEVVSEEESETVPRTETSSRGQLADDVPDVQVNREIRTSTSRRRRVGRHDAPDVNSYELHISENGTSDEDPGRTANRTDVGVESVAERVTPTPAPRRNRVNPRRDVDAATSVRKDDTTNGVDVRESVQTKSSTQSRRIADGDEKNIGLNGTSTSTQRQNNVAPRKTVEAETSGENRTAPRTDDTNGVDVNSEKLVQKETAAQRRRQADVALENIGENDSLTRPQSKLAAETGEEEKSAENGTSTQRRGEIANVDVEKSNEDGTSTRRRSRIAADVGDADKSSEKDAPTRRRSRIADVDVENNDANGAPTRRRSRVADVDDNGESGAPTRRRSRIAAEIDDVDAELARPRYRRRDRDAADADLDVPTRRRSRNGDVATSVTGRARATLLPEDGTLELNSAAYGKVATLQWGFRAPGYADRLDRRRPLEKMNGDEMALRGALLSADVDKVKDMVSTWPHKVLDFRNVYGQSGISPLQNGHVGKDQSEDVEVFPKRPIEYSNPVVSWSRDVTKAVVEGLTTKTNSGFQAVCMQNVLPDKDMTNDFATAALGAESQDSKMEGTLDVYMNVWLKWGYSNSEKLTKALAGGRGGSARMRLHASSAVVHRAHRCYKFVGELINTLDPEVTTGFEVYENEADLEEKFKDIVKLKNLTSLTLAGCLPEGTSPEYLQTLVSSMPNLRRLDVRRNPLTGWFAELLGTASPLQYLNIAQCGVSQIDLYFLANSHHIGQLEELDLSGTDLTGLLDDVTQLLLQASGNLKWLGTAECNLGAHAQTVLELLEKLPYLEEWDLNDNEFTEEDVCKIVEACAKVPGFHFLKITPPATVNSADPKEGSKEVRRFDGLVKAALRRACADEDRKMRCLVTYKLPEYKDEPPTLI
ncbi:uncharacterized protein LOC144887414 [Branchiostoma floridae x Branchiostoma japonicum]